MDNDSTCTLVLCGKSAAEREIAKSLKESKALKLHNNGEVSLFLESEMDGSCKERSFDVDLFMNSLSTNQFGRFLIWSPRLTSTQDVVSDNFFELPIGAVCVADVQYKGRAWLKSTWESPAGCLLYSFTLQLEYGSLVPMLQFVLPLAVMEAVKEVSGKNGLPYLDLRIKWPNDIYLDGFKVGGILCSSRMISKKFNVSAGIGLNLDNEKPTTCLNAALRALSSASTSLLSREAIMAAFFNQFEKLYEIFVNQGFQSLEHLYYESWLQSGQKVIVLEKDGDKEVQNFVTIQGITSSGYLSAIGDDNEIYELHPKDNSFNFFVRRKSE